MSFVDSHAFDFHTLRRQKFFETARIAYGQKKLRSHKLVKLAHEVGIKISAKTILQNLRECEIRLGAHRPHKVGRYNLGKMNCLPRGLEAVALAFSSWFSYYFAGMGEFNVEAILRGERPP